MPYLINILKYISGLGFGLFTSSLHIEKFTYFFTFNLDRHISNVSFTALVATTILYFLDKTENIFSIFLLYKIFFSKLYS